MLNWRDPDNPLAGGAERVTLGYLSALARRNHEVVWFANAFENCEPETWHDGVRVVRGGGIGTSVFNARRWAKRQRPFDLVIDQHHGLPWFAPWWHRGKSVAYIHEVLGPIWNSFYSWPWSWAGRRMEARILRWYRKVPFWTACPATERALRDLGISDITLIPYGVATAAVEPLPEKTIRPPWRLAVVSRLAPNKRIDHAVEAVRLLRLRGHAVRLTIAGTGETETELCSLTARLQLDDSITFAGQLSEASKLALLDESHLLLHTSIREGWGLNVIEANCRGVPAVVYPVPGLTDSTLHERTGLVVAHETPEALANGIERLAGDAALYRTCRRAARDRGASFHWDRVLPAACDWLESLAAGSSRPPAQQTGG